MSAYDFPRYVEAGDGFLLNAKEALRAGRERTAMPVHRYPQEQGLTGKFNEMVQSANNLNR